VAKRLVLVTKFNSPSVQKRAQNIQITELFIYIKRIITQSTKKL